MDKSSLPTTSIPIVIPEGPLTPMLRLGHFWITTQDQVQPNSYLRTLSDFEFVFQIKGSAWIWVEAIEGSLPVEAGNLVFIPPQFPHAWGFETGAHIAVHFDLHAQPQIGAWENIRMLNSLVSPKPASTLPVFSLMQQRDLPALLVPLISIVEPQAMYQQRLEKLVTIWQKHLPINLENQLLISETICRVLWMLGSEHTPPKPNPDEESHHIVSELLTKLALNLAQWPKIPELAHELGMGQTTFRTVFQRVVGCSPRRYIEQQKLEHASRLLIETNMTISNIALTVGYDDPYHFSRVFKRVMGLSPRQFRRKRFL